MLHHALCMRGLTSIDRLALWLTFPTTYTNFFVWLYTWPASSMLNVAVDSGIPFVRKHMISILASDTVRSNAAQAITIPLTSSSATRGIARRPRHRQVRYASKRRRQDWLSGSYSPPPPLPPFSFSSAPKRPRCFFPPRVGHVYNYREDVEQERRKHAPFAKALFHSEPPPEHTLSSSRTHARMPSWN